MRFGVYRAFLALFVVLLLVGTVQAQAMEIYSGQSAKASLDAPGMWHAYRFEGLEGDLMTVQIVASKKTTLQLVVQLFAPSGETPLPEPVKGKLKIRKQALEETGLHLLLVYGEWPTIGDYKLKFKLKRMKIPKAAYDVPADVFFDAAHGSRLTAKIKAAGGSGLLPGVDAVNDPTGVNVLVPAALKEKGSKATVKKLALPTFGQHRMEIHGKDKTTGSAGVKLKIKPPKRPEKKIGKRAALHTMIAKIHRTETGIARFGHVLAEVVALDTTAVRLRFPEGSGKPDLSLTGSVGNAQVPGTYQYEENFDTEAEMNAAFPDGFYTLLLTRGDGSISSFPLLVSGTYPSDVTITDMGTAATPTITWTGCDGAQFITVDVRDVALDTAVLVTVLPGDARAFGVPTGVIQAGRQYMLEVRGYSPTGKQVLTKATHDY